MSGPTAVKLIWSRLSGACSKMAASLDDYLFDVSSFFPVFAMDLGTQLLLGWIFIGVFVFFLTLFVYNWHLKPRRVVQEGQGEGKKEGEKTTTKPFGFGRKPKGTGSGATSGVGGGSSAAKAGPLLRPQQIFSVIGIDKYAVEWVNQMLAWIFNDLDVYSGVVEQWVRQLNSLTSSSATEHGIQVTFDQIQPESLPPTLNNATIEVTPKDDISLSCNVLISKLGFVINTSRQKGEKVLDTVYVAKVTSYTGKLKAYCNPHELSVTAAFAENPKLNVIFKPVSGNQDVEALDEQALQDVLTDIISTALSTWVLKLHFSDQKGCPPFRRPDLSALPVKPIHYDSMTPVVNPIYPKSKRDKRLLVKLIKASGLGVTKGCQEPFCIVEMDDPPQKHQTSFGQNTNSPFWDEHFLFDLNSNSSELLFEIYDKAKVGRDDFLGLGIVGVDDLLRKPSQRQIIPLQNRPYEEDAVSGCLTVEFLFMEPTDIPFISDHSPTLMSAPSVQQTRTETNRLLTPGGAVMTTMTTTINKPVNGAAVVCSKIQIEKTAITPDEHEDLESVAEFKKITNTMENGVAKPTHDVVVNGGDPVTDTALRELETRLLTSPGTPTSTNKSTLIIHSVQREVARPSVKVERTKNGKWHEVTQPNLPELYVVDGEKVSIDEGTVGTADSIASSSISGKDDTGRSRPKDRRSFMNTLRKRFSFRSKRSKSMEQPNDRDGDGSLSRSVSADRSRGGLAGSQQGGSYLGVPGGPRAEVGSTRSSLSGNSGMSETSTQTYLSEVSTLVIETLENGVLKHYLLPASMATKSKWRKRGTKLHIYNDHTFTAKHFSGSTPCQVCHRNLPRRMGKQGYECRDCQLRCHKLCHVKTETPCSNSTVNTLELSYDIIYAASKKRGNAAIPVANGHNGPNALLHRRPLSVVTEEEYVQDPSASVLQARTSRKSKSS